MIDSLLDEIYSHALIEAPRESCGIIIVQKGRVKYLKCTNDIPGTEHFMINKEDYAKAEDLGDIAYIVHSHPATQPNPSPTDLVSIEQDDVPWLIVNPFLLTYSITKPSGYTLPYIGRIFHHGITDCYSLVRDYYLKELGITLGQYTRPDDWWIDTDYNFYFDNFGKEGFVEINPKDLKQHDLIFMRVGSSKMNHAAIYIGNNKILHHPMNRLSSRDIYGGWWQKITGKVVRHKTLL